MLIPSVSQYIAQITGPITDVEVKDLERYAVNSLDHRVAYDFSVAVRNRIHGLFLELYVPETDNYQYYISAHRAVKEMIAQVKSDRIRKAALKHYNQDPTFRYLVALEDKVVILQLLFSTLKELATLVVRWKPAPIPKDRQYRSLTSVPISTAIEGSIFRIRDLIYKLSEITKPILDAYGNEYGWLAALLGDAAKLHYLQIQYSRDNDIFVPLDGTWVVNVPVKGDGLRAVYKNIASNRKGVSRVR